MTIFADTYDRVLKMRAERDMGKYPAHSALEATLADLEKAHGTWKVAWGEINRLQRIHGSQIDMKGQGAFRDDQPSLPIAGRRGRSVSSSISTRCRKQGQKRRYGVAGHSFVGAVELATPPKLKTILQFGESSDPSSPHWFDQAALYAKKEFKPSWYAQADIDAHTERRYHPGE